MLAKFRDEINKIDAELARLFDVRRTVAEKIAEYKNNSDLPILNADRETEVIQNIAKNDPFRGQFFANLMDISKCIQVRTLLRRNIVLIGMMGSGKSTVGAVLSDLMDLPLIDTDSDVEETANRTITDIFAQSGETEFRHLESDAIRRATSDTPRVIATGGGVVKSDENMQLLRKNGLIFFLNRPPAAILADIDTESRPLLTGNTDFLALYNERLPLYTNYADCIIEQTSVNDAARAILTYLESLPCRELVQS